MYNLIFKTIIMIVMCVTFMFAQEDSLDVLTMDFCEAIENSEPVGISTVFPDTIEKVFCYTVIKGAMDSTSISHIWYYEDEEIAEVELMIEASPWRTWSSKNMMEDWTGIWKVKVISPEGDVLKSKEFTIESTSSMDY